MARKHPKTGRADTTTLSLGPEKLFSLFLLTSCICSRSPTLARTFLHFPHAFHALSNALGLPLVPDSPLRVLAFPLYTPCNYNFTPQVIAETFPHKFQTFELSVAHSLAFPACRTCARPYYSANYTKFRTTPKRAQPFPTTCDRPTVSPFPTSPHSRAALALLH
ncbi:hypothetical protein EDB83DRAFT_2471249 [Lactarius deliciosus]|nr:hypothetical protein EDB83DRAFT_2471249 [Lactarius deliciosus]